jgi:hypothetical protein
MRIASFALLCGAMLAFTRAEAGRQPVEVEMSNVDLHITSDFTLHVRHLHGRFEQAAQHPIPNLDDATSYTMSIDTAVVAIDLPSLNAIVTRTLAAEGSNVDKLTIGVDDKGDLKQKGVISKGVPVPFTVTAGVEATPDGKLRVFTKSVKGFGVPIKPLMKIFHIELDDLLKVKPGHGVTVRDNDVILDPATLLPAPSMRGVVTAARIEDGAVVQTFGDGAVRHLNPPAISKNFIYWRGGTLQFGKLTMTETDLELVDEDPKDPFDFSVEHWHEQQVAGYSKTTASRGLKAHMPDYNDVAAKRR